MHARLTGFHRHHVLKQSTLALTCKRVAILAAFSPVLVPGVYAASTPLEEVIVTARKVQEPIFITPHSVEVIDSDRIKIASFRSTPDIFREVPGAMVQKTAYGQGSPYLRGFTGFRNLFMIDGIRLNNSVFRDGPNQYWSTVDTGSIERVELVRGPASVLYGSDAIGGTVNVLTRQPRAYTQGQELAGDLYYRHATAEHSNIGRASADIALSERSGLLLGGSVKDFGDIESGDGKLPNTGYDEWDADAKAVYDLSDSLRLTGAHYQVHQHDVPRTHSTIYAVPYKGTTVGSDLQRNLDQDRALTYGRLEADEWLGLQDWDLTVYHSLQKEEQTRVRSGDRRDQQGFKVNTYGFNLLTRIETNQWGDFVTGGDWAHDIVDSHSSSNPVQGPVADDSTYDWAGVFVENLYHFTPAVDLTTGVRLGYFNANAGSISDPVDGSEFSYRQDWLEPVGSVRLGWAPVADQLYLYGGISQGYRAPNLSDLTRYDTARSNEFEVPSVDLDPERFSSYELGGRFSAQGFYVDAAAYYTDIKDQIQRLLTGRVDADGNLEVTKANVGNGEIYGFEVKTNWTPVENWLVFGTYAWLDGRVDNEAQVGAPSVRDYPDRLMPANYRLGLQYRPASELNWWAETEIIGAQDADRLSLRDEDDTQRIPPGGTQGYTVWNIRGGLDLLSDVSLNLVVENVMDDNYRIHGSGQNETGRNFIASVTYTF
jgi:hemoglobin/transferrin/lactoferrin receptor protein